MKQTNFHTHTSRCHHAFGNDEEFVRTAIQNGFEVLGFSDHACWKYDSDFVAHMRMKLDEFAKRTGLSKRTIHFYIDKKLLKPKKSGNKGAFKRKQA